MRIAGSQYFDVMRAVVAAAKKKEHDGKRQGAANDRNQNDAAADSVITAKDLEKTTLFGILFPAPVPGKKPEEVAPTAPDKTSAHAVDVYV